MLSDFSDPALGRKMLTKVQELLHQWTDKSGRRLVLMEVCGTHTVAFSRSGIRELLKPFLELKSGPGCPVCVTDQQDIDNMLALAALPQITVATFGDMMRVPGSSGNLAQARAEGADVQVVYSPLAAVALAEANPKRRTVFLGIGFETTVPTVAAALAQAETLGLDNFSLYSVHKLAAPVIANLLEDEGLKLDGLILPGHVAAITGRRHFDFVGQRFGVPAAITGFAELDLLAGVEEIVKQLLNGKSYSFNAYPRVVREEGNTKAWSLVERFFEPGPAKWRGLGELAGSGLVLRPEYAHFDAKNRYSVSVPTARLPKGCLCGEILKGKALPFNCRHFAAACNPLNPVGPCMVSAEGTCAAYYKYERRDGALYG